MLAWGCVHTAYFVRRSCPVILATTAWDPWSRWVSFSLRSWAKRYQEVSGSVELWGSTGLDSEFAPWQLKGMNAKAIETGLACCPVWRRSNVEAFRRISPHRINQMHRCLGVREKEQRRERGKDTQEEGEQKRRKVGDRDRTRHRNSQRPLQTQRDELLLTS